MWINTRGQLFNDDGLPDFIDGLYALRELNNYQKEILKNPKEPIDRLISEFFWSNELPF